MLFTIAALIIVSGALIIRTVRGAGAVHNLGSMSEHWLARSQRVPAGVVRPCRQWALPGPDSD